jgi:hypothetical protein
MRSLLILLLILTACTEKSRKQASTTADTTQVIELALKTVLGEPFPEMDGIKRKSNFSDSFFLTTSLFSLSHLPASVDSFRFKVLPDSTICSVIKSDTATTELPNYLRLESFEKTDTDYFVKFESIDCIPSPSRDGAVSLRILKSKDKFVFKQN